MINHLITQQGHSRRLRESLEQFAERALGCSHVAVLPVADRHHNLLFNIAVPGDDQFLLKVYRHTFVANPHQRFHAEVSSLLRNRGRLPVPSIQTASLEGYDGHPAILMERLPGQSASEALRALRWRSGDSNLVNSISRLARFVPRLCVPLTDDDRSTQPDAPPAHFTGERRTLDRLVELRGCEKLVAEVRQLLDRWEVFHGEDTFVRGHGDCHLGNFLVDEHLNLTGVVDWEASRLTYPERDKAAFLFGCISSRVVTSREAFQQIQESLDADGFEVLFLLGCNLITRAGYFFHHTPPDYLRAEKNLEVARDVMLAAIAGRDVIEDVLYRQDYIAEE